MEYCVRCHDDVTGKHPTWFYPNHDNREPHVLLCRNCSLEYDVQWHIMWVSFVTELDIEKALKNNAESTVVRRSTAKDK